MARLLVLGGIWGASFLFIAVALRGVTAVQLVLARLVIASLVLLALCALRRQALPRDLQTWRHLAVLSAFALVLPFTLFSLAVERMSSGLVGVVNGTVPLFTTAAVALALPGERLSAIRAAGVAVGFLGVVVVLGADGGGSGAGAALGLFGAACYGAGFTYTRRFIAPLGVAPLALSTGQMASGALMLGLLAPWVATDPVRVTAPVVASVAVLGAVGTGLAYVLYHRLVADEGATSASMVTYLIPVIAVILGVAVLEEPVGWNLPVGALVVALGVALAEGRLTPTKRPCPPGDPVAVAEQAVAQPN